MAREAPERSPPHKVLGAGLCRAVVENLAKDLRAEFPGACGFSTAHLWRIKQFYEAHTKDEKLAPLVREISWTRNLAILERCKHRPRACATSSPIHCRDAFWLSPARPLPSTRQGLGSRRYEKHRRASPGPPARPPRSSRPALLDVCSHALSYPITRRAMLSWAKGLHHCPAGMIAGSGVRIGICVASEGLAVHRSGRLTTIAARDHSGLPGRARAIARTASCAGVAI